MRTATLDLGTNTFLCLIADVDKGVIQKVLEDQVRVVRLGQDVNRSRRFHPEALKRADECLSEFRNLISKYSVDRIAAFATSAARDVQNANELFAIGQKVGIPIDVISGQQEAECTFWGTVDGALDRPIAIVDVGGGSTEFIIGDQSGIRFKKSLDIGSVRLTELFITNNPVHSTEIKNVENHLHHEISKLEIELKALPSELKPSRLIAVAGTPTTIATLDMALPFESDRVHGYEISLARLRSWTDRLAALSVPERQNLAGMEPKRADVIVAGALTLYHSCRVFELDSIEVSIRGLRYGIAKLISLGQV